MIHVMDLKRDDRVLVITDEVTKTIGDAFYKAAEKYGCRTEVYLLPEEKRPLTDIPPEISRRWKSKTVVINVFRSMSEETPFRVKLIKEISSSKTIRLGHGPGITESIMMEGPMNVDYRNMLDIANKLIRAFEDAKSVHITTPEGTDVVVDIENRPFQTDVKITKKRFGNLPCGEISCAPIESDGNGTIVCDVSIGDLGKVQSPFRITIENGRVVQLEHEDHMLVGKVEELIGIDDEASIIGELGIGLNIGARLTGNPLEDEKAFNTAHIAFGNNEQIVGGQNCSKTHRDFLFFKPTLNVTFKDDSREVLIEDGMFNV
jgi:leucyl aminopeptidase (aminopeptidase T)